MNEGEQTVVGLSTADYYPVSTVYIGCKKSVVLLDRLMARILCIILLWCEFFVYVLSVGVFSAETLIDFLDSLYEFSCFLAVDS